MEEIIVNIYIAIAVIFAFLIVVMLLNLFNKKVLRKLNIKVKMLFYIVPITILFMVGIYYIIYIQTLGYEILFMSLLTGLYLLLLFFVLFLNLRMLKRINRYAEELGKGKFELDIDIYGSKEFFAMENHFKDIKSNNKLNAEIVGQLNREFNKFIPKQFFDYLGKKDVFDLTLGSGVQKEVTIFFCDIRDSFKMSESLSLDENFKMINSYLTVVAKSVRKYDGFIDKYLGDGVLAVFLNANSAMECAVEIANSIEYKNMVTIGESKVDFGIALHTGKVVIGIIGEKYRVSPTVISDTVNLASRLENINKLYGTRIIFTKDTMNTLGEFDNIHYRYIGTLELDDNKDLIPLFENLDCFSKSEKKKYLENKADFENGVRLYEKKDFKKAKVYFVKVYNKHAEDNVTKIYLKKCNFKLRQFYKKK